jgi:dTDP-4-amino-4,6-dideoxygalactose transaminase
MNQPAILGGVPVFSLPIPFVRPALPTYDEVEGDVRNVVSSGTLTKGPYLASFERAVAAHLGVREAVAVSSCTAGLMLTYQALGLTGEVIVPSFTFMATVHALAWNGARPVFVDVHPGQWTLDPARVEEAIRPETAGIVGVHTFGNPGDVEALGNIARRHGVPLVFDAAHGFGVLLNGAPVGRYGAAEVFSTSPTKLLITGEGGVVATEDDRLAAALRVGREYGNRGDYSSDFAGMNARMPELSAILGLHSLERLEAAAKRRNEVAEHLRGRLGVLAGIEFQQVHPQGRSSYNYFGMTVDERTARFTRDQLAVALRAEGIDTRKYFNPPLHRHPALERRVGPWPVDRLPVTERLARQCLQLPIHSEMEERAIEGICEAVERIAKHADAVRMKLEGTL